MRKTSNSTSGVMYGTGTKRLMHAMVGERGEERGGTRQKRRRAWADCHWRWGVYDTEAAGFR